MFSKLKNKILKKENEEEETPFERAKRDVEEHYKPISVEDTFKDLKYYVSDCFTPEGLEEKYEIGRILNEPRIINFTTKIGYPQGYCRFLILSNHMIPSSNPDFKDLDVYMNKPNSKFKVVDYFRFQGISQIALLHLPDEGWERFSKKKLYDGMMGTVRDFLLECLKMDVVSELDCEEWHKREILPVGITYEGDYFELDALNNYGHYTKSPNKLSDKEEIDYAFERLWKLTEVHLRSFCISDLLIFYDLDFIKDKEIIENKLWTDIKNGLPLAKVDERFKEYFKEEFRKKHPYAQSNFHLLDLFVKDDNESKRRLNETLETYKAYQKFTRKGKDFNDEYIDLMSAKNFSRNDLFSFNIFLLDKIEREEISSKDFSEKIKVLCDEYYKKFVYNRNNYPKTLKKAIAFLIRDLDLEEIKKIKDLNKHDFLLKSHFSLGKKIRNEFGIFNRVNTELLIDCEDKNEDKIPLFLADSYSHFILGKLWDDIQENYEKIIKSKKDPNSFYYKELEEGKIPAPIWFRYPNIPLDELFNTYNYGEDYISDKNNLNVPSPLTSMIDESKPAQYVRLMKEVKVISKHTLNCLPFTPKGEPIVNISLLKEEFLRCGSDFCDIYFNMVEDKNLTCSSGSFFNGNTTFLSVYDFILSNKGFLFGEIRELKKEMKDRKKFRFFNSDIFLDRDNLDNNPEILELENGFAITYKKISEEKISEEKLWEEIVDKYSEEEIWDKIKYTVALNGLYIKAMQDDVFRENLLDTRDKFLINYNIYENEWGVHKEGRKLIGKNLYGLALMEVRDEIRRLYQNADMIDWEYYKNDYNKDYDLTYVK